MSRADKYHERLEWLPSHGPNYKKIMVVEFNTGGANFIPVRQLPARQTRAAADDSSVSFSASSLEQTLKQTPQVRPEKIAAAAALLADGSYPSDAAMNQLAGFLARRL